MATRRRRNRKPSVLLEGTCAHDLLRTVEKLSTNEKTGQVERIEFTLDELLPYVRDLCGQAYTHAQGLNAINRVIRKGKLFRCGRTPYKHMKSEKGIRGRGGQSFRIYSNLPKKPSPLEVAKVTSGEACGTFDVPHDKYIILNGVRFIPEEVYNDAAIKGQMFDEIVKILRPFIKER